MNQRIFCRVKEYIGKYRMLAPGDTVVMGVSGGADSVCMFLLLCELAEEMKLKLTAVHVNHGIRKQADEDADYVRQLCEEHKVPFVLVREDVKAYADRAHLSEEEAGRKVRYQAFEEVLAQCAGNGENVRGRIAVAHNANDRAETMLFHLFRGTGLTGAGGIRPVRGRIIRPVMCLKREEIELYLKEREVPFCIDCTNLEDTYTRNRIRNHILPYAQREICQGAVAHMCETADMLSETEEYIRRQAQKVYDRCVINEGEGSLELNADLLKQEEGLIRRYVFLMGLEQITAGRKDIMSVHVKNIDSLLYKDGSKQLSLPYGLIVRKEPLKEYDRLIMHVREAEAITRNEAAEYVVPDLLLTPEMEAEVPGTGRVKLTLIKREDIPEESEISAFFLGKSQNIPQKSCTKWFDYDRITKSLVFRIRQTGDYLTINAELSKKTLKEYMIGEKIPKNERDKIYVLADGSHVLWVPGYRISEYYKITERTEHILQVQIGGEV